MKILLQPALPLVRVDFQLTFKCFCPSSRLIANPKGPNNVQPIAVGEVLGKITAKNNLHGQNGFFQIPFAPIQHWVAVEGVSEMLAHPVQSLLQNQSDWIILKSDVSNALILSAEAT